MQNFNTFISKDIPTLQVIQENQVISQLKVLRIVFTVSELVTEKY
ncbi:MAG: hypothetical protein N4J56_004477 [Chroococcidiopsis sp. SAG 2025]|nr:hypothetical protein [Chroococcidiopsis sp. SAG 2025]